MSELNGKFKSKKVFFTQVSNSALRNNNLSLKAKGLYALIQSYITIPEFTLYKSQLLSMSTEKEKAFDSAWNELKNNGYLKQYKMRVNTENCNGFIYEYELLDEPNLEQPSLTIIGLNGEIIENKPKVVHPQKVGGTKGKVYKTGLSNNIDLNNTYSLSLNETKQTYGKFNKVTLTLEEHQELLEQIGQAETDNYIDDLDTYKESSGKYYESDYATILKWIKREKNKKTPKPKEIKNNKQQPKQPATNKFHNFIHSDYEPGELDKLVEKRREKLFNKFKEKDSEKTLHSKAE